MVHSSIVTIALIIITLVNGTQGHFSHSVLLKYFGYSARTAANNIIEDKTVMEMKADRTACHGENYQHGKKKIIN